MTSHLLPPNATAQERALSESVARLSSVPVPIRETWNPDTCPTELLSWLAWAFGCDEWSPEWSEDSKRQTIRDAVLVQQRKGSVWSVRRVLQNAGYGDAEIKEGIFGAVHDAEISYDGFTTYGNPEDWAKYRVILERPITNAQAEQVRRILKSTAPARCHLVQLIFTQVTYLHNAVISYDGTYNYGTA